MWYNNLDFHCHEFYWWVLLRIMIIFYVTGTFCEFHNRKVEKNCEYQANVLFISIFIKFQGVN